MTVALRLYVAGSGLHSEVAERNVRELCASLEPGSCELEVVDVSTAPELADEDRILATPTLVKRDPPPTRKVIGDLGDRELLMQTLSLPAPPGDAKTNQP
ncbi:MAG TPA: circadian clock KaiB family protein [Solirubrobacteraceae bacterium]|jgi:circadian clock protein KaiB|nr:circadian clock KaiB family protein [Solirubrobacteraceae bacterium]